MCSRAFLLLGLFAATLLLISSAVVARDLAQTSTEKQNAKDSTRTNGVDKAKYGDNGRYEPQCVFPLYPPPVPPPPPPCNIPISPPPCNIPISPPPCGYCRAPAGGLVPPGAGGLVPPGAGGLVPPGAGGLVPPGAGGLVPPGASQAVEPRE